MSNKQTWANSPEKAIHDRQMAELDRDGEGNWIPRYQTKEIVILSTSDPAYGRVVMPAMIRYAYDGKDGRDTHDGAYEVNALVPTGMYAAGPQDLKWWTVQEHEIVALRWMSEVEYEDRVRGERVSGRLMLMPDDNTKEVRQLGHIWQGE